MLKRLMLASAMALAIVGTVQACESGLSITANLADGKIIKLDDGSVWKVFDTVDSSLWSVGDDVLACDDRLVNIDEDEEVEATRIR
jgi:hypothetical protein